MGAQKNRLNETGLLNTQNICSKLRIRKYLHFYAEIFGLSKPVVNAGWMLKFQNFEHFNTYSGIISASIKENLILLHANNKGTDQHAHPHSLIGHLCYSQKDRFSFIKDIL